MKINKDQYRFFIKIFISFFLSAIVGSVMDLMDKDEKISSIIWQANGIVELTIFLINFFEEINFKKLNFLIMSGKQLLSVSILLLKNSKEISTEFLVKSIFLIFLCSGLKAYFSVQSFGVDICPLIMLNSINKILSCFDFNYETKQKLFIYILFLILLFMFLSMLNVVLNNTYFEIHVFNTNIKIKEKSFNIPFKAFNNINNIIALSTILPFDNFLLQILFTMVICVLFWMKLDLIGLDSRLIKLLNTKHIYIPNVKPGLQMQNYLLEKYKYAFIIEVIIIIIGNILIGLTQLFEYKNPFSKLLKQTISIFYLTGMGTRIIKSFIDNFYYISGN